MDLTPVSMTPHGHSQLVKCPYCGAAVGSPCATKSGGPAPHAHRRRWEESSRSAARDAALFAAKVDDPGQWRSGDLLIAKAYRYDNEKVTVLRLLPSGRDPGRNAYRRDLRVLRVLTAAEASRLNAAASPSDSRDWVEHSATPTPWVRLH